MSCRVPLFVRRGEPVLYKGKQVIVIDYTVDYTGVDEGSPEKGRLMLVLDTGRTQVYIEYSYLDIKPVP